MESSCASRDAAHRIDFKDSRRRVKGSPSILSTKSSKISPTPASLRVARSCFEADSVSVHEFDGLKPKIRYSKEGRAYELICDFIAGCDGFHGICRPSIPAGILTE